MPRLLWMEAGALFLANGPPSNFKLSNTQAKYFVINKGDLENAKLDHPGL